MQIKSSQWKEPFARFLLWAAHNLPHRNDTAALTLGQGIDNLWI